MAATQRNQQATKSTESPRKAGRKASANPDAPHGLGADGKPLAPYGTLANGKPRRYPQRETGKIGKSLLAQPMDVTDDVAAAVKPSRARSDEQQEMDQRVYELYRKWVAAGSPSDWASLPKLRYDVPPEMVDDLKFLIRKAGTLNGVRIRFGTVVRNAKGEAVVVFAAMDKTGKSDDSD